MVNAFALNPKPVVAPTVVVNATPPEVADSVNVVDPLVAMMKYVAAL
jgi:hypothetical protein